MDTSEFRRVLDSEKERAYSIICERTDWLNANGIKQWTAPLPRSVFEQRQNDQENYGLFRAEVLTVFLSLVRMRSSYWTDEIEENQAWWLETLASDMAYSGECFGQKAVRSSVTYLSDQGEQRLYLDCVQGNGFLPVYYGKLGFDIVAEKVIDFPKCGNTHMVLMKHDL